MEKKATAYVSQLASQLASLVPIDAKEPRSRPAFDAVVRSVFEGVGHAALKEHLLVPAHFERYAATLFASHAAQLAALTTQRGAGKKAAVRGGIGSVVSRVGWSVRDWVVIRRVSICITTW
jgi:hypothetical protein